MAFNVILNGVPQYWIGSIPCVVIPYVVYINGYRRSDAPRLLDDQFPDIQPDPNGTYSKPGPGIRKKHADTLAAASVSGGKMLIGPGPAAWGDPAYYHVLNVANDGWDREAGLAFFWNVVTDADTAKATILALWPDTTIDLTFVADFYFGAGGNIYHENDTDKAIGTWAASTEYDICLVARSTGYEWWIRGGTYTQWTLLKITDTGNDAELFPGFNNHSWDFPLDDVQAVQLLSQDILKPSIANQHSGVIPTCEDSGPLGLDGTYHNVGLGDGAAFFNGENAYVELPVADLLAAGLDSAEGMMLVCASTAVPIPEGPSRNLMSIYSDNDNQATLVWSQSAVRLTAYYEAGNVLEAINVDGLVYTDPHCYALSWSQSSGGGAGEVRLTVDGAQVGSTQSIANAWNGPIVKVEIGAKNSSVFHYGDVPFAILALGLAPSQVNQYWLTNAANTITTDELDARIGVNKWAWYEMGQWYTSDGVLNNSDTVSSAANIQDMGLHWYQDGLGNVANAPVPGAELLDNWSFVNWTADNPDDWTVHEAGNSDITEVASGESHADAPTPGGESCNMYRNGADPSIVSQVKLTIGEWYIGEAVCSKRVNSAVRFEVGGVGVNISAPSTTTLTCRATNTELKFAAQGSLTDVTFDSSSAKNLSFPELLCVPPGGFDGAEHPDGILVRCGLDPDAKRQSGCFFGCPDLTSPEDGCLVYLDLNDSKIKVVEYISGVSTELSSVAVTPSSGGILEIRWDGGTGLHLIYDDSFVVELATLTPGAYGGQHCKFGTGGNWGDFAEVRVPFTAKLDKYTQ